MLEHVQLDLVAWAVSRLCNVLPKQSSKIILSYQWWLVNFQILSCVQLSCVNIDAFHPVIIRQMVNKLPDKGSIISLYDIL
jgi:hypothetical protein